MASRWLVLPAVFLILTTSTVLVPTPVNATTSRPIVTSMSTSSGRVAGGNRVTVEGTGFTKVTSVKWGTVPGTKLHVINPHELLVTAPAHDAGQVSVSVFASGGRSAAGVAARYYFVSPPSVRALAPSSGLEGQAVQVTGAGLTHVRSVAFGGVAAASFTVRSAQQLTAVAPTHALGRVQIEVTTDYGHTPISLTSTFIFARPSTALGWSTPISVDRAHEGVLGDISCADATFCAAIDYDGAVVLDHGTWSAPTRLVSGVAGNGLVTIDCPSAGHCVAMGYNGQSEPYGSYAAVLSNGTWTPMVTPDLSAGIAISCSSASDCWAIDYSARLVHFDGTSFTEDDSIQSTYVGMQSVSCPTATFCVAVGNDGTTSVFDGDKWTPLQQLPGRPGFGYVSCANATFCMALTYDGDSYRFDGREWTGLSGSLGTWTSSGNALDCQSAMWCLAAGVGGATWIWNGTTWSSASSAQTGVDAVGCAAIDLCVAVGTLTAMTWNGNAWTAPVGIDYLQGGPNSVTCPDTDFCALGDNHAAWSRFTGGVWHAPERTTPDVDASLRNLVCTEPTFCMALTGPYDARSFDGTAWSDPVSTMNVQGSYARVNAFDCVNRDFCIVLNDTDYYSIFDGTRWSTSLHIDGNDGGFRGVSCADSQWCAAVSTSGQAFVYSSGTWSAGGAASRVSDDLAAVSCPARGFCVAVGQSGNAVLYRNGRWSAQPLPASAKDVDAVSCGTVDDCVAIDYHGDSYYWDGLQWLTTSSIDTPDSTMIAVSCVTARTCVVTTGSGDVIRSVP